MTAQDIKTDEVPHLIPEDSVLKALQVMEEFRVAHVPVVKNGKFLGMITEDDALTVEDLESPLERHRSVLLKLFVMNDQHVFDIIKMMSEFHLTNVAITDNHQNYMGCITAEKLVNEVAQFTAVTEPGSVIVLDLNVNDYSMSEIARIVEGNDAKILSSFVTSHADSVQMELTLKINKADLSGIIQTFNRYNYTVSASYHESKFDELMHDRYEELMKYLNM